MIGPVHGGAAAASGAMLGPMITGNTMEQSGGSDFMAPGADDDIDWFSRSSQIEE